LWYFLLGRSKTHPSGKLYPEDPPERAHEQVEYHDSWSSLRPISSHSSLESLTDYYQGIWYLILSPHWQNYSWLSYPWVILTILPMARIVVFPVDG